MGVLLRALTAVALALVLAPAALAADPRRGEQWGLAMVEAPAAWPTSTGVGAAIAVIDTGVQSDHPDLGGRLLGGYDFVSSDQNPQDGDGHGTHVAGIAVANRDNNEGVAGVAPGAQVLPYRVLGNDGTGLVSDTIKAVDRAVDDGAHVINLSLGDNIPLQSALIGDPDYAAALKRAVDRGIVVVLAAGNNGLPICENPKVEGILCVGAVDSRGERSAFSSFGEDVHLMAPGGSGLGGSSEDVLSSYKDSAYEAIAGTSQATPHVAGVAALLISLGKSGQEARERIIATAKPIMSPGSGAGIVNAKAAVAGLSPPPSTARGSFSTRRRVTVRRVRRRGFRVTCRAARAGRCAVAVTYRGRRIARGRRAVPATTPTTVVARLNKRGRRVTSRVRSRIRVRMSVTLPGEAPRTRRITVRK